MSWWRLLCNELRLLLAWAVVLPLLGLLTLRDWLVVRFNRLVAVWQFAGMDPHEQEFVRQMGEDPDSMIGKREL